MTSVLKVYIQRMSSEPGIQKHTLKFIWKIKGENNQENLESVPRTQIGDALQQFCNSNKRNRLSINQQ